jgi:hypothetical protein
MNAQLGKRRPRQLAEQLEACADAGACSSMTSNVIGSTSTSRPATRTANSTLPGRATNSFERSTTPALPDSARGPAGGWPNSSSTSCTLARCRRSPAWAGPCAGGAARSGTTFATDGVNNNGTEGDQRSHQEDPPPDPRGLELRELPATLTTRLKGASPVRWPARSARSIVSRRSSGCRGPRCNARSPPEHLRAWSNADKNPGWSTVRDR